MSTYGHTAGDSTSICAKFRWKVHLSATVFMIYYMQGHRYSFSLI